jgi:hypothetical protein
MQEMKADTVYSRATSGTATPVPPESLGPAFSFIRQHRILFLTTPLWLGAIMIALHTFGGPQLRAAIDFLNGVAAK